MSLQILHEKLFRYLIREVSLNSHRRTLRDISHEISLFNPSENLLSYLPREVQLKSHLDLVMILPSYPCKMKNPTNNDEREDSYESEVKK